MKHEDKEIPKRTTRNGLQRKLIHILSSMIALSTKTKQGNGLMNRSVYMIEGEKESIIDLYDEYFKEDIQIKNITYKESSNLNGTSVKPGEQLFKTELISPIKLFKEINEPLDIENRTRGLDYLEKNYNYLLERVGNLRWIESYMVVRDNVRKIFMKEFLIMMPKSDGVYTSNITHKTEDYECINRLSSKNLFTNESTKGQLQKISFNYQYGYYKLCLVLPRYRNNKDLVEKLVAQGNDFFYLGIDRVSSTGSTIKTVPKAEFLMVKVPKELREKITNRSDYVEDIKTKMVFLDYYEKLDQDVIFYFKLEPYIFYKNFSGNTKRDGGAIIDFGQGYEIENIIFKMERFFLIMGKRQVANSSRKIGFIYIYIVKEPNNVQKHRHILDNLFTCMSKKKAEASRNSSSVMKGIDFGDCFVFKIEGNSTKFLNDFRIPGDLSIVFEFMKDSDGEIGANQMLAIRWNENTKNFENYELVDRPDKVYSYEHRFDTKDYFITILAPLIDKSKHVMGISPVNYNAEMQVVDNPEFFFKINNTVRVHKKNDTGNSTANTTVGITDSLLAYSFDSPNAILMKRSTERIYLYSFSKPKIIIKLQEIDINITKYISGKEKSHLCENPFNFTINYEKPMNTTLIKVCYAPDLILGSHFPNKNPKSNFKEESNYPTGYILRTNINELQFGSFLNLVNLNDPGDNKKSKDDQIKNYVDVEINYFMAQQYQLDFRHEDMDGIYAFKMNGELEEIISVCVSLKNDNFIYRGSFHPSEKYFVKLEKDTFIDFRKIEGVLSMENNLGFIQIQELSYSLKLDDKASKLPPWNGINGICSKFIKLRHRRIGNLILCFFKNRFFIKFFNQDTQQTDTKEVAVDSLVQNMLEKPNIHIEWLKASDELSHHFILIYLDRGTTGDERKLRGLIVELFGDLYPIILLSNDVELSIDQVSIKEKDHSIHKNILDVEIAGEMIVLIVSKSLRTSFVIYRINNDYTVTHVRTLLVPKRIALVMPLNVVVGVTNKQGVEDYDKNRLVIEQNQYFIGCLVSSSISHGASTFSTKKRHILVLNPSVSSINSLNLIPIPKELELISFGPLYSESMVKKNIQFALLCKLTSPKNPKDDVLRLILTKQIDSIITFKTEFNIEDIIDSPPNGIYGGSVSNNGILASKKKLSQGRRRLQSTPDILQDKGEEKIANFRFKISSQIFDEKDIVNFAKMHNNQNAKYKELENYLHLNNSEDTSKTMKFLNWFEQFKPSNSSFNVTRNINSVEVDHPELEDKKEWEVTLSINNDLISTKGKGSKRFIKLDPHKFAKGSIIDSFGLASSLLERDLGMVMIPNMTTYDTNNTKTCYKPRKDMNVLIFTWCKNDQLDDYLRIKYGCSGQKDKGLKNDDSGLSLNYMDELMKNSQILVTSQYNLSYYDLNKKECIEINKEVHKDEVICSNDFFINRLLFQVEHDTISGNYSLRIIDLSKKFNITEERVNGIKASGKEGMIKSFKYTDYVGLLKGFKIKARYARLRVDRLEKASQDQDYEEYLLIAFEINPKTGKHLMSMIYRVKLNRNNQASPNVEISNPLSTLSKVSQNVETFIFHNKKTFKFTYSLLSLEWYSTFKMRVKIWTILIKDYNKWNVTIDEDSKKEFVSSEKIMYIELGSFKGIDRNFAINPVIVTPQQPTLKYYNENYNGSKEENTTESLKTSLIFIISFPKSNDFMIRIPGDYYNRSYTPPGHIHEFEIVPISNPFIGFMPNKESPKSIIQGDMFYHVRNYEARSYFLVYQLRFLNFIKIKIKTSSGVWSSSGGVQVFSNIMGTEAEDSSTHYKHYIHTNAIMQLKRRSVAANVFTNLYGNNSQFENLLVYSDPSGNIFTKKFSEYININLETEKVASSKIFVWIRGPKGYFVKVIFKVLGYGKENFFNQMKDYILIVFVIFTSLIASYMLTRFVKLGSKMTSQRRTNIRRKRESVLFSKAVGDSMMRVILQEHDELNRFGLNHEMEEEFDEKGGVGNMGDYIDSDEDDSDSNGGKTSKVMRI